jgi:serine protease AprX
LFVHVADLDQTGTSQGSTWTGIVTITVHDEFGLPVSGTTVTGSFLGGVSGTDTCQTGADGTCQISKPGIPNSRPRIFFFIDDLDHPTLTYDPAANGDPDGDSNGSVITIFRP